MKVAHARMPVTSTQILSRRICHTCPWVHGRAEKRGATPSGCGGLNYQAREFDGRRCRSRACDLDANPVAKNLPYLPLGPRRAEKGCHPLWLSWVKLPSPRSTWTVQAPHCAIPHPNFVPVKLRMSRRTHRKGISGGASKDLSRPLIFSVVAI